MTTYNGGNSSSASAPRPSRRRFLQLSGASVAAVGGSGLLAACASGGSSGSSSSKKSLTVLTSVAFDPIFAQIMQHVAGPAMGVKVTVNAVPDIQVPTQAASATQSGNPPDIIFWSAQGVSAVLGALPLEPLDSYLASEDKSAYYPQDYQAGQVNGKTYGLGVAVDNRAIVYRKDYAAAAGLKVPQSWSTDEFGAWTGKITNPGRHYGFGFEAQANDGRFSSNFLPMVWSTGAKFVVKNNGAWDIGFTAAQMNQVLTFYYNTVNKWHSVPKSVVNWGYTQTDGNYGKGVLASYSSGPFVQQTAASYPTTLKNTGVAPLPQFARPANFWEEFDAMINSQSSQKDLAWKFIETMRSEKIQSTFVKSPQFFRLPVRRDLAAHISNPVVKGFAQYLDVSIVPEAVNITPIMNNAVFPAIESMALKGTSPAAATQQLMTNMKSSLSQVNTGS